MQPLTYPGVYIQELPSGNRTLVGVSTSITAFVGRARRGPLDEPVRVTSFAAFQRTFGALWKDSPLGYAVQQYFLAGGADALIVRVQPASSQPVAATLTVSNDGNDVSTSFLGVADKRADTTLGLGVLVVHAGSGDGFTIEVYRRVTSSTWSTSPIESITVGAIEELDAALLACENLALVGSLPMMRPAAVGPTKQALSGSGANAPTTSLATALDATDLQVYFQAASPGSWANRLYVQVDHDTSEVDCGIFNLTVRELDTSGNVVQDEVFRNVSMQSDHPRYVGTVLAESSSLLALSDTSTVAPTGGTYATGAWRPAATSSTRMQGGADGGHVAATDLIGAPEGSSPATGMYSLVQADLFNLLCLPPPRFGVELSDTDWGSALSFCEDHRAVCIVDAPSSWASAGSAATAFEGLGLTSENGAMYFPWVQIADSLRENRLGTFAPCGVVAGLIAKTDAQRGIWKAPAGLDARTPIVRGLEVKVTDEEQGLINPLGLNCLRTFPGVGTVVWGGRTLAGNDRLSSDWKYLAVRRLALYVEESLYRGLQWAVFEPNDEPLWAQIRASAGGFMSQLFRQGAFKGAMAKDAYFVKCDAETTTDQDVDRGIVNVQIGFAPLKPAEFVVISIQQIAGQSGT